MKRQIERVKELAQGHITSKWQSQGVTPGSLAAEGARWPAQLYDAQYDGMTNLSTFSTPCTGFHFIVTQWNKSIIITPILQMSMKLNWLNTEMVEKRVMNSRNMILNPMLLTNLLYLDFKIQ